MDAGGLRAFSGSCPPASHRFFHEVSVLRKSGFSRTGSSRSSRKASIVVATNAAVADDVDHVISRLRFRKMGLLVPSSVLSFSQGALLQAKAKTISYGDESPGVMDTVVTIWWRHEDGGMAMESRTTSGRSASTSGLMVYRPSGSRRSRRIIEIESPEILARQATPRVTKGKCRSMIDTSSTTFVIEHPTDAAAKKAISDVDHASVAALDCTTGLSVTIDAVDYFPSASTSSENGTLSVQESRLNLSTNLNNISTWEEALSPVDSRTANPNSSSEAKRNSLENLQKQLSSLTSVNKQKRGCFLGKAAVRGAGNQWPDNIESVLPVNPNKDPTEYLFLYAKLLRVGRLEDCVAILESMDEYAILNMKKVNPHEFYSACKKTRALKEAFRFSRLVGKKSLRNYSMLLSVCAQAQDALAACRVLEMVRNAGLTADCIFYTTLISACAKAGRIDLMFKFLNEMETEGVHPNVRTFGAMIDGCARAGDVPKAFGIYKKMLNQNVKPDRVIFNTLIGACGRAGALLRAFEILADMQDDPNLVSLDHFTYGALIAACARAGEVERALEVYKRMRSNKVARTAECYTAAVHACSQKGYLKFALSIYEDMKKDTVKPDEVFFCALIDVAGQAGKLGTAFAILQEMKNKGIKPGPSTYNTLMVVCSNVGDAEGAMHIYEEIKSLGLNPSVSTLNALMASLCMKSLFTSASLNNNFLSQTKCVSDPFRVSTPSWWFVLNLRFKRWSGAGRELDCALTKLQEFRTAGVMPNKDTYSILLAACEREDQASIALKLYNHSKDDSIQPTLKMCNSVLDLCIRRVESEAPPPHNPRLLNINIKDDVVWNHYWANQGLIVYDDLISAGLIPTLGIISQVLGCLRISAAHTYFEEKISKALRDSENMTTINVEDACGVFLPRALTVHEDATTLGVIQNVNYAAVLTSVDMKSFPVYAGEVAVLALLKGLKHRHDEGLHLNSVKLIFAVEEKELFTARGGFKRVQVSSRTGEAVMTLLRKLRIKYEGHESAGEVTISTSAIRTWARAIQKVGKVHAVETNSLSCKADSVASVMRFKQRLSHYSLRAIENAPVV